MKGKLMKLSMLVLAAAALAVPVFAFDSVEALMKDSAKRDAELLKTYLAEHPKADDARMAHSLLVRNLMHSDQAAEATALLEKNYEALVADKKNADLRELIGGTVLPLLSMQLEAGQKDKVKAMIARVEKDFADDENIGQIKKALAQIEAQLDKPSVGETMDLKFKSSDGRDVDLAALKDKVVLVDFWATWCGPCVAELPNVKKAYEKFHDKGFEIVGISLDDDKGKLEKFTKKENMPWPQSCSGDGWDDALAKKYGIKSIPAMFLIGKDGKIASVNTRGPGALEKKLEELLK
jgi:thiol-disulfide isomerase/thioredoxin